jgi:hypothetical protein
VSAVGAIRCLSSLVFAAKLDRVFTRDGFEILVSLSSGHDLLNLGASTMPEPKATAGAKLAGPQAPKNDLFVCCSIPLLV